MRDERAAFLDVVDSFLIQRHDLSDTTRENYRRRLNGYARWCEDTISRPATVGDLEGGTVDSYLAHLRVAVSPQTARSAWVALRSLAQYLAERKIVYAGDGLSVLRLVPQPKVKDESRRALTDEEMFRLQRVSSEGESGPRDYAIVMTLLGCGLRRGELVGLAIGDVSLSERRVHVRASVSKSIHSRDVTIPIETLKALDVYLSDYREGADEDVALFVDRHGDALTGNAVRKLFERLATRAGIRDVCAHMLRHTWATNFHRSGSGSRFDLMTEGGWTTGKMVERYTKARPFEERRRAPSPFTAPRNAMKEKRPLEKWPSPKESGLSHIRTA